MTPKIPIWIGLLLLSIQLIIVQGYSTKDAPPDIIEVSPATIGYPESYIVVAKIDPNEANVLKCVAENADDVYWKYKPSLDADYADLPAVMTQLPLQDGLRSSRTLTDISFARDPNRPQLHGYYQCFAKSNYIGNNYETLTPLILMLYAEIHEVERYGIADAGTLYGGAPTVGKPYRLPCIRDPSLGNGGYRLNPPNAAELPKAGVTFRWEIRQYFPVNKPIPIDLESEKYKGRVRMDPRTGDLYFALLETTDSYPRVEGPYKGSTYQCSVIVGFETAKPVNELYLSVAASNAAPTPLSIEYPLTDEDRTVTCVEKSTCRLTAIFGGALSINAQPTVVNLDNNEAKIFNFEQYGVSFKEAEVEYTGRWEFTLIDTTGGANTRKSVILNVKVNAYPVLKIRTNFPKKRIAFTGDRVVYECDPEYTESFGVSFYINGVEVKEGQPSFVTFDKSLPTMFSIDNVTRAQSASIACVATNNAGTMFELADLTVFDAPRAELEPKLPYEVKGDNTTGLLFNCSFVLDPKTDKDSVRLWWKSNRTGLEDRNITEADGEGVGGVKPPVYNSATYTIESELNVLANSLTQSFIENTQWWCECSYTVLGNAVPLARTNKGLLLVYSETGTPPPQARPFQYTFVIVGSVLGLLFLILLIILIHCYVQKNKGEQYRVDENERKAGHNPEEEMKAYGYVDYNRPDQNPVKGSRASMNFSERPLESDHGSMDEYGDIDTGRFNEDGSFIGEYRGQNNHRNQADV